MLSNILWTFLVVIETETFDQQLLQQGGNVIKHFTDVIYERAQ